MSVVEKFASKHDFQRSRKPHLSAPQDPVRYLPLQASLKDELCVRTADLVSRRQGGRVLHDSMIEKRHSELDRIGHAHPVRLDQKIVDQPGLRVEIKHPAQGVPVPRMSKESFQKRVAT